MASQKNPECYCVQGKKGNWQQNCLPLRPAQKEIGSKTVFACTLTLHDK